MKRYVILGASVALLLSLLFLLPRHRGEYGSQGGSAEDPIVFRMWSTNFHGPLVGGKKSFVVIPDGRHYGIDLIKGTIAEAEDGDLVAWIKRPEKVGWRERYDWSCELTQASPRFPADS